VDSRAYFAAPDPEISDKQQRLAKLCESIAGRVAKMQDRPMDEWQHVHQRLYRQPLRLMRDGREGELVKMHVATAKALLKSQVGLILGPPIMWRPSARNSDVESRSAVLMTANLLEFFWKQFGLGTFCGEWCEAGIGFKAAYALPSWEPGLGKATGVDYSVGGGQLVFAGGLRIRLVMPWDVYFDEAYRSWEELPWVCVRTWEPRHRLAALEKDEERREAILAHEDESKDVQHNKGEDVVGVYNFFHKDLPELPGGMTLRFLSGKIPLSVGPFNDEWPERFAGAVQLDSPHGDSQWQATMQIEELTDGVHSSLASNLSAFGTQSVSIDARDDIQKDKLNNLLVFSRQPGSQFEPKGMQLTSQPNGADKLLEMWAHAMLDICGLNDVSQGQPDTAQMNAEAFALLASKAVERNGQTQRRMLDSIAKLGLRVVKLLAENMPEEVAVAIAGKSARLAYPSPGATKTKLGQIASVFVEVGNALEQTPAGRLQLFQMYQKAAMDAGKALSPEDIQQVVETGRLEQAVDIDRDEDLFIAFENDEILAGRTPQPLWTDDHLKHGKEHRVTTLTPAARQTPAVVAASDQHLMMHYTQYWDPPPGATWGPPPKQPPDPALGPPLKVITPRQDPQFPDRIRILLGQQAPGQVGPPSSGGAPPPGQPPSDQPAGAPPALAPPQPPPPESPEAPPTVLPQ
jgi:hypothetical protein